MPPVRKTQKFVSSFSIQPHDIFSYIGFLSKFSYETRLAFHYMLSKAKHLLWDEDALLTEVSCMTLVPHSILPAVFPYLQNGVFLYNGDTSNQNSLTE